MKALHVLLLGVAVDSLMGLKRNDVTGGGPASISSITPGPPSQSPVLANLTCPQRAQ